MKALPYASTAAPDIVHLVRRHGRQGSRLAAMGPYLYLAPAMILVAIFLLYPALDTAYLSLTDAHGVSPPAFIGFQNYAALFTDPSVITSVENTLVWVIATLLFPVGLGLLVAVLVNRIPGENLLKSIFYLPYAVSLTSTGVLWSFILSPYGVLNSVLDAAGLGRWAISWLIVPPANTYAMIGATTWQSMGTNMVLFLVGLKSIPAEPIEAARVDGAGNWQTFRSVTWPLLRPFTAIVVAMAVINSFKVFDIIWVMTQGGPYRSSETLAVTMYRDAFVLFQSGYGSAIAMFLSAIVIALTVVLLRTSLREEVS